MPNITFERVVRDCPANANARNADRALIYDFKVMIDGEHRATFSRTMRHNGYYFGDVIGRGICLQGHETKHLGATVDKKADFAATVEEALQRGLIPTADDIAAHQEATARRVQELIDAAVEGAAKAAIAARATDMFERIAAWADAHPGTNLAVFFAQVTLEAEQARDRIRSFDDLGDRARWAIANNRDSIF